MDIQAIDLVIQKLSQADKPLSIEGQHKLSAWLSRFIVMHDEKLWTDCFLKVNAETEEQKKLFS